MAARSSTLERAEVSVVALYISRISYIKQMSRCVALAMFGPLLIWDEGGRGYKPPARSPIPGGTSTHIHSSSCFYRLDWGISNTWGNCDA